MGYQILARNEDKEILKIINKMLKIKEGDKLVINLEDDTVFIKKIDEAKPISCRNLKQEEVRQRLIEAMASIENGEVLSEQEVWNNLENVRYHEL